MASRDVASSEAGEPPGSALAVIQMASRRAIQSQQLCRPAIMTTVRHHALARSTRLPARHRFLWGKEPSSDRVTRLTELDIHRSIEWLTRY
jgi:hypothetical protein